MPGLFVTFEGGEGSGKSTQLARIGARLERLGIPSVSTREPGGTELAESIRALLLDPGRSPSPVVEALMIEAARADLVDRVLAPALSEGRVVLCDRFTDSTLAYQGYGRGLDLEQLAEWNRAATRGLTPDLTLLFDLDPESGIERRTASGAPNRIDSEPLELHARVRAGFLRLAAAEPDRFVTLDATLDVDRLEASAWAALEPRLERFRGHLSRGRETPR